MRAFLAACPAYDAELDQVENVRKSCCAGELHETGRLARRRTAGRLIYWHEDDESHGEPPDGRHRGVDKDRTSTLGKVSVRSPSNDSNSWWQTFI